MFCCGRPGTHPGGP